MASTTLYCVCRWKGWCSDEKLRIVHSSTVPTLGWAIGTSGNREKSTPNSFGACSLGLDTSLKTNVRLLATGWLSRSWLADGRLVVRCVGVATCFTRGFGDALPYARTVAV